MPDLPAIRPKRLVAALKRLGFYEVRQKGSHLQLKRGDSTSRCRREGSAEIQNYDMVVVRSGPRGYVAGIRAGQSGLKTLIVEQRPISSGAQVWQA